jgi:hypothetical protein
MRRKMLLALPPNAPTCTGIFATMNEQDTQWFFVFFGLFCVIGGARQIVARKGVLRGKSKKSVHFEGREAVVHGVIAVAVGLSALLWCFYKLMTA